MIHRSLPPPFVFCTHISEVEMRGDAIIHLAMLLQGIDVATLFRGLLAQPGDVRGIDVDVRRRLYLRSPYRMVQA